MLDSLYGRTIDKLLIPRAQWRPFPTAAQRPPWESLPAAVRQATVEMGEAAACEPWPALPATLYLDYARTGTRARFEAPHFQRRRMLGKLVIAECVEGRGRFIDSIVDGLWTICEESSWCIPAHISAQKAGVTLPDTAEPVVDLFAAETGAQVAWAAYLLGGALAPVSKMILPRLGREIASRILTPCLQRDDFWWMGFKNRWVNNWNPWINSNWLACALLCESDEARRIEHVRKILRSLDCFIDGYPADGGCDEGPVYWTRAGASLFDCLELLHWATGGKVNVYDQPLVRNIGQFVYRAHISGQWFINFADASALLSPPAELVYLFGRRIGDADMQAFGARAAADRAHAVHVPENPTRSLPALFVQEELAAAPAAQPLLRDVYLPDTQVFVARDQGGSDKGLFLAAKGGHNAESHNHNDVGQFMVYADGKPLLIDVGVETYTQKTFSPQRYEIWTMQSQYHNLPTINGAQQQPGREFAARDLAYQAADNAASFGLDIAAAYAPQAGAVSWRRTLTLNRGRDVVVEDRYELRDRPGELVWTLMTPCAAAIEAGAIRLSPRGLARGMVCGQGRVEFDPAAVSAEVETIAIADGLLRSVWGDTLFRIVLGAKRPAARGSFTVRITR